MVSEYMPQLWRLQEGAMCACMGLFHLLPFGQPTAPPQGTQSLIHLEADFSSSPIWS